MGATTSRDEDAALLLAVPKHTVVGGRRLLDSKTTKCAVCKSGFSIFNKKHYCRRCGSIICEKCSTFRHYRERNGYAFRICSACNTTPIIHIVPIKVWHRILAFAGNVPHHRTIQVCRKLQLSVPLPYPWGASWDAFFLEGVFISKGANGSVYRTALRSDPKTPVAVKVVQKNTIFSLRKWHHIQREIDTLRACKHKHVIELLNVFQSPESVFIVLQYAQGGDLFDWLMTRKAPSESEVRAIAAQLLSTLHFIHDVCGAVHRDIKPENIILLKKVRGAETPWILLADFGFARLFPRPALVAAAPHPGGRSGTAGGGMSGAAGQSSAARIAPPRLTEEQKAALREVTVAATPCGTLGFAAPEIIEAYSSRRELHRQQEEQELRNKKMSPGKPPSRPRSIGNNMDSAVGAGPASGASSPAASAANFAADESASSSPASSSAAGPMTNVELMKKMDIFAAGVTICILLTGCEPFPCHSSKAHLDAVNEGMKFEGRQWAHVSMEARDMLRKMLHAKAEKRPTAFELLQMPWLRAAAAGAMNANFLSGIGASGASSRSGAPGSSGPQPRTASIKVSPTSIPATSAVFAVAPPSAGAGGAASDGTAVDAEFAASFQQSLRSLRKNNGMIFMTDKTGVVHRMRRNEVLEDTLNDEPPTVVDDDEPAAVTGVVGSSSSGAFAPSSQQQQLQQQQQQQAHSGPLRSPDAISASSREGSVQHVEAPSKNSSGLYKAGGHDDGIE